MHALQERLSPRLAGLCALGTGVAYALAQAPFGLWPLAFVCLVPVGIALRGRGLVQRIAIATAAGVLAGWLSSLLPVAEGLSRFFDRHALFGIAAGLAVTGFFGGVGFACFAALAGDPGRGRPACAAPRFGLAFAAGELVRSHVATGMPWALLGHALAPAPRAAQLAAVLGVIGLGAVLATANAAALVALRREGRRAALATALVAGAAIVSADLVSPAFDPGAPGSVAIATRDAKPAGALRVALVQPGPLDTDPLRVVARIDRLVALSQRALPVDLVLWPENAFGAALPANESLLRGRVAALAPRPALLFGAPRYDARAPSALRNAAVLWDAQGRDRGVHDKVHLLPFTEYVPRAFASLGVHGGHTTPGERLAPLDLDGTRIGVLVCYELLFARIAGSLVEQGAGVLVNPSNDAWFGASAGGDQMLAAAVLRAIETRRPLLRVTPTGITAAIDARGRVVVELARDTSDTRVVDVVPSS